MIKIMYLFSLSFILTPLYLFERIVLFTKLKQTRTPENVVFIIGHWRSGTTFLHNSLISSGIFHYINTYQAFMPNCMYYGGPLIKLINKVTLPKKRPMDNMEVAQHLPQEEEFATACMFSHSFYHSLLFPSLTKEMAEKYLFNNVPGTTLEKQQTNYKYLISKINLLNKQAKPLLLKNPALTCRISELKKIFPSAKFIYLKRDERTTIKSMQNMFGSFLKINSLSDYDMDNINNDLSFIYHKMIEQFEKEKKMIDPKDIIEIDYSDFTKSPNVFCLQVLNFLNIKISDEQLQSLNDYIRSQSNYKTNEYS